MKAINGRLLLFSSVLLYCTIGGGKTKAIPLIKKEVKPIVVAVIDTGFDKDRMDKKFLCKFGHKDFTGTGLADTHGHGSHISGLIHQYVTNYILDGKRIPIDLEAVTSPYCQVILKYFDPKQVGGNNLKQEIDALQYAINIKVDVINFSGGGLQQNATETLLIKKALDMGIKVVVAAGNEYSDLSKRPYYPASLDTRLYVVGNLGPDNVRLPSSNYGTQVNTWEYGKSRMSWCPGKNWCYMTGTSQATAVKSGKLIRQMLLKSNP